MIVELLTKPLPKSSSKAPMLSLIHKVQCLDVSYYVMGTFFCDDHLCNHDLCFFF